MPELICDRCKQNYMGWFTDNDLWNKHVRDNASNFIFQFLCPTCFCFLAETNGDKKAWWFLTIDKRASKIVVEVRSDNNESDAIAARVEFVKRYPDAEHTFGTLKCHHARDMFINGFLAAKAHVS